MNKSEDRISGLKTFMITRFMAVMLFIYISDKVVDFIYQYAFTPLFRDVLKVGEISINNEHFTGVLSLLMAAFWKNFAGVLPVGVSSWVSTHLTQFTDTQVQAPAFIAEYGDVMVEMYYNTIIILGVLLFVITILPYLLGAWWYCRNIVRMVGAIREADAARKADYDKQRNLLFSDIAHDIKTPITTVVGYSKALNDGIVDDPEKKSEYLRAIYAKSMRISNLITMLFEYVKIDSAGFTLHQEVCDLPELIRENVIMVYTDAEEKHMEIEIDVPDDSMPVYADKVQLSRVVTNLLTNAIKYISAGDVIRVSLTVINNGDEYLIYVGDTGVQIDDKLAECIFDPFSRGDAARSTTGGSGLGLSIAHKLVALHGGELTLNRKCTDGCTKAFEIRIPVYKGEEK